MQFFLMKPFKNSSKIFLVYYIFTKFQIVSLNISSKMSSQIKTVRIETEVGLPVSLVYEISLCRRTFQVNFAISDPVKGCQRSICLVGSEIQQGLCVLAISEFPLLELAISCTVRRINKGSGEDSLDFLGFLTLPPTTSRLQFPILSLRSMPSVFNAVPR